MFSVSITYITNADLNSHRKKRLVILDQYLTVMMVNFKAFLTVASLLSVAGLVIAAPAPVAAPEPQRHRHDDSTGSTGSVGSVGSSGGGAAAAPAAAGGSLLGGGAGSSLLGLIKLPISL